jgi:hypothetical protein
MDEQNEELKMQIANLLARISMLEVQVAEIDDDMPEQPSLVVGEEAELKWTGICREFFGSVLLTVDLTDPDAILGKYICFHTGISPTKHASGTWPKGLSSGAWSWDTEIRGAPYMAWEVAEAIPGTSPAEYRLVAGKTVGDIRVTIPIPTASYQNIQQGSASENKIVTQYPRTH